MGLQTDQDNNSSILDAVIQADGEELWCHDAGLEIVKLLTCQLTRKHWFVGERILQCQYMKSMPSPRVVQEEQRQKRRGSVAEA